MNYLRLLLITVFCSFWSCAPSTPYTRLKGNAFGSYYSIVYRSSEDYRKDIETLLSDYSKAVSRYDSSSELSEFNRRGRITFRSPYLKGLFGKYREIHRVTDRALEPTIMPLVKAWAINTPNAQVVDSTEVDSLLFYVDFEAINVSKDQLVTTKKGQTLDLNAIGEGYGIDLLTDFFIKKGIKNFKIEIGGEMRCHGKNPEGKTWNIGIENPVSSIGAPSSLFATVKLDNCALSTSGSYRQYFTDSLGRKYTHIIDPKTGFPVRHHLLSVSIKAKDGATADGVATACMVMGKEKAIQLIERLPEVEGFLMYEEDGKVVNWQSEGFGVTLVSQ